MSHSNEIQWNNGPESELAMEAISQLYYAVYKVDVEKDEFCAVKASEHVESVISTCKSFTEACRVFTEKCIHSEDVENVKRFASLKYLEGVITAKSPKCALEFRRKFGGTFEWIKLVFIGCEFVDEKVKTVIIAAENIDSQKNSSFFSEQVKIQNYVRKINLDADRRIRDISEKSADERSAMLLKMETRGRLLSTALQKISTQAFEYDVIADKIQEISDSEIMDKGLKYSGNKEDIANKNKCSDRDALGIESAFQNAMTGQNSEVIFMSYAEIEPKWKKLQLQPVKIAGKSTGNILGVITDITREKKIEKLAKEEQEFRNAVLGTSAGGMEINLSDNSWRYLWTDDKEKTVAATDDYDKHILSASQTSVIHPDDYSSYYSVMNRQNLMYLWENGTSQAEVEYRALNENDDYIWFKNIIRMAPKKESGEILASVYSSDINERKIKELEDEKQKKELEEAAKVERRANEMKSRFMINMSHELRTPLNAILGMSQLALREEMSNEARSYVHGVRTGGTSLMGVVNSVLDLAKIETGIMEIVDGEYQPLKLMSDVAHLFEYQATDKNLEFVIVVNPEMPRVLIGDEPHIRQILINLINNALKYTEEGKVIVTLDYKQVNDDKLELLVSVKDTGIGLTEEDASSIFDEYNNDTEQSSRVGLSISRSLVNLMGGDLKVESVYGQGSLFSFEIPQQIADREMGGVFEKAYDNKIEEGAFWNFSAPDATVMLVDDNFVNLRVGIGLLRPFGMRVITASSGKEAIAILKKENVDLILMDHMMPEMDGLETTQKIRLMGEKYKKMPIIALTANAMKGVREMLIGNGMDDYISKPVEMWELSEKVRQWLPKEKIVMQMNEHIPVTSQWPTNLPDIPGVDVAKGLSYVCTYDDYITCLRDFWCLIPEKAELIERLVSENDIYGYTVQVHALKSSARLIGADNLSDKAAKFEKYGKENLTDKIISGNPSLMKLYRSYIGKLEPFVSDKNIEDKKEISEEKLIQKLKDLLEYVKAFDCDSADHWSDEMRKYNVPAKYENVIDKLHMNILAAKFSDCVQIINQAIGGANR